MRPRRYYIYVALAVRWCVTNREIKIMKLTAEQLNAYLHELLVKLIDSDAMRWDMELYEETISAIILSGEALDNEVQA